MLEAITFFQIFGKPLIMYLGVITLLSFIFTAMIASLNKKGIHKISFKWHSRIAIVSILLAVIHGTLGVLYYF